MRFSYLTLVTLATAARTADAQTSFDDLPAGQAPSGWTCGMTGSGSATGKWSRTLRHPVRQTCLRSAGGRISPGACRKAGWRRMGRSSSGSSRSPAKRTRPAGSCGVGKTPTPITWLERMRWKATSRFIIVRRSASACSLSQATPRACPANQRSGCGPVSSCHPSSQRSSPARQSNREKPGPRSARVQCTPMSGWVR